MKQSLTVTDMLTHKRACEENMQRTIAHLIAAFYDETGIPVDGVELDVSHDTEPHVHSVAIKLNLD